MHLCINLEIELVDFLKQAAKLHYDLTKREALKLAYLYDNGNVLKIPLNLENNECAGNMFLRRLRQRFPSLTLRKPESTSSSRAPSLNK